MKVFRLDMVDSPVDQETVVCLGMFDGIHLGHQALLLEGKCVADEKGWALCAHTYDILPVNFIHQHEKVAELTPLDEKIELFKRYGADIVAVDVFNDKLLRMPGRAFFESIVAGKLNAKHVVAGFNHRFGYRVDSGKDELAAFCEEYDIGLSIVPAVMTPGGDLVSSTAIRNAILAGDLSLAAQMLGREIDPGMVERVRQV